MDAGMTKERWAYLKNLKPGKGLFLHVSCTARMVPDPADPVGKPMVPMISKPGISYRRSRK